jgi:hypothetical protein
MKRTTQAMAITLGFLATAALFDSLGRFVASDPLPGPVDPRIERIVTGLEHVSSPNLPVVRYVDPRLWSRPPLKDPYAAFRRCNALRLTHAESQDPACRDPLALDLIEPEAPSRAQLSGALQGSLRDELAPAPTSGVRKPQ